MRDQRGRDIDAHAPVVELLITSGSQQVASLPALENFERRQLRRRGHLWPDGRATRGDDSLTLQATLERVGKLPDLMARGPQGFA
jgi:hypothetical protein